MYTTFAPRERCVRINLSIDSTITKERGVGVVIGGKKKNTNKIGTARKERKKDTIRHDKETDRYVRHAAGDHDYSFCDNNQSQQTRVVGIKVLPIIIIPIIE